MSLFLSCESRDSSGDPAHLRSETFALRPHQEPGRIRIAELQAQIATTNAADRPDIAAIILEAIALLERFVILALLHLRSSGLSLR